MELIDMQPTQHKSDRQPHRTSSFDSEAMDCRLRNGEHERYTQNDDK
ncbi:hypothetical protein [Halocatena halophila]